MVLVDSESSSSMESVAQHDVAPTTLRRAVLTGAASFCESTMSDDATDERQKIVDEGKGDGRDLVLLFLGCEAKPPYGPYLHTAGLFMDLMEVAIEKRAAGRQRPRPEVSSIVLRIYPVSQGVFPTTQDLHEADGVILPGSFNSAYDEEKWILRLKELIQSELVAKAIPALGVCFGHQIYAHSFGKGEHRDGGDADVHAGSAAKCPAGPQAGRKTSHLTEAGQKFLKQLSRQNTQDEDRAALPSTINVGADDSKATATTDIDLFYTHGDMVEKLPLQGVSLVGNDKVPIQAAIYFAAACSSPDTPMSDSADDPLGTQNDEAPHVIAVTFQAHPEYASSKERGLEATFQNIIREMAHRGDITTEEAKHAHEDAMLRYEHVREQSIDAIISACELLGWFPAAEE